MDSPSSSLGHLKFHWGKIIQQKMTTRPSLAKETMHVGTASSSKSSNHSEFSTKLDRSTCTDPCAKVNTTGLGSKTWKKINRIESMIWILLESIRIHSSNNGFWPYLWVNYAIWINRPNWFACQIWATQFIIYIVYFSCGQSSYMSHCLCF